MAKRLTDTDKWKDDWYVSLSNDYKTIWQWLLDNCTHSAICKRSLGILNMMCKTSITEDELIKFTEGRVIVAQNNWFIPNFLKFQYVGLHSDKPAIVSVRNELIKTGYYKLIPESFGNDYLIIKDTDTDTDTDIDTVLTQKNNKNGKTEKGTGKPIVNFAAQAEQNALDRLKKSTDKANRSRK